MPHSSPTCAPPSCSEQSSVESMSSPEDTRSTRSGPDSTSQSADSTTLSLFVVHELQLRTLLLETNELPQVDRASNRQIMSDAEESIVTNDRDSSASSEDSELSSLSEDDTPMVSADADFSEVFACVWERNMAVGLSEEG